MKAKSNRSQFTSSVNCIATKGTSNMHAVTSAMRIMFSRIVIAVSCSLIFIYQGLISEAPPAGAFAIASHLLILLNASSEVPPPNGSAISCRPCDGHCQPTEHERRRGGHRVYGLAAWSPC